MTERTRAEQARFGRLAERTVPQALALACAVRDEDRDGIGEWLAEFSPEAQLPERVTALLVVLAAMVPVDGVTPQALLDWVQWDEAGRPLKPGTELVLYAKPDHTRADLKPCGTAAALSRHYANGERPCDECKAWKAAHDEGRDRRGARAPAAGATLAAAARLASRARC